MPIMIVDDNSADRLPIEYFNEYIDMELMVTSFGNLFTPTPLQDPEKFMYNLNGDQRQVLRTIISYMDMRSVCYGYDDGSYLFPIDSGINMGVMNTRIGTIELRRDGTLFIPKHKISNVVHAFSITEYSECINGKCNKNISDLLSTCLAWATEDINASKNYIKTITKEEM